MHLHTYYSTYLLPITTFSRRYAGRKSRSIYLEYQSNRVLVKCTQSNRVLVKCTLLCTCTMLYVHTTHTACNAHLPFYLLFFFLNCILYICIYYLSLCTILKLYHLLVVEPFRLSRVCRFIDKPGTKRALDGH